MRNKDGADLAITDLRSGEAACGDITLGEGGDFSIPPSLPDLYHAVSDRLAREKKAKISLSPDGSIARFGDISVRLTETEGRLLSLLLRSKGFVSREALLLGAFGEGADGGLLNVYIHYLREKLERSGTRVIISSRKEGYKIDEIFKEEE